MPAESAPARELAAASDVVVDGRCDPDPKAPVGVYATPSQDEGPRLAQLSNGTVLDAECLAEGDEISNQAGAKTTQWVRFATVDDETAYIPAVWVQGEEVLDAC
jgi:hypothetical protein